MRELRKTLEDDYHYEVWEPNFNITAPLFPQLKSFLDRFFEVFHKPGNLLFIYFGGRWSHRLPNNLALYTSFLEVVEDYLQDLQADSLILIEAHTVIRKSGRALVKSLLKKLIDESTPRFQILMTTDDSTLLPLGIRKWFADALRSRSPLDLSKIFMDLQGTEIYPRSTGSLLFTPLLSPPAAHEDLQPDQSPTKRHK